MSITQTITALPTPPNPDDPTTFDDRAYAFTEAQVAMATELNTMISQINSTETNINTAESNASMYASNAQAYSESAASSANFRGAWSSSTTYALGDSCYYNEAIWRSLVDGNLNNMPFGGSAYWAETWRQNMEYGQCILKKSGSDLSLIPYNGNQIFINGDFHKLTSPCTLAAAGLSADTLYYIYAYMSGSTVMLEASATTHTQDSTHGHEIKSGDATRSLVGMAKTITGPAWVDTNTQRYVRSWYNRNAAAIYNAITSDYVFSVTNTWVEIDASTVKSVLCWDDEVATMRCVCSYYNNNASSLRNVRTGVGIDSARLNTSSELTVDTVHGSDLPLTVSSLLAEGAHTFHLYGFVSGGIDVYCRAGSYISVEIR